MSEGVFKLSSEPDIADLESSDDLQFERNGWLNIGPYAVRIELTANHLNVSVHSQTEGDTLGQTKVSLKDVIGKDGQDPHLSKLQLYTLVYGVRLMLQTSGGRIGMQRLGFDSQVVWNEDDHGVDDPTTRATFNVLDVHGDVIASCAITGNTWREIDSQGDVMAIPLAISQGCELAEAVEMARQP